MARRGAGVLWAALLLALVVAVPPVTAYEEADAGLLWSQVQEASHSPFVVQPHTQWSGTLVLRPGHDVVSAQYQICRVGEACFAPPAPAARVGNDTFTFDTRDYRAGGRPVDYVGGWRIGVQWLLTEASGNGTVRAFPQGPSPADPVCAGDQAAIVCQERHYLAFDMAPEPQAAPTLDAPAFALLLLGLAAVGRVRSRHA